MFGIITKPIGWLFDNFPGRFLKVAGGIGVSAVGLHFLKPHAFRFMCDRAFEKIDMDHNNFLDAMELQLAVYELYNRLNKRLPGWADPPNRDEILLSLKKFDKDGNMRLDKFEFHEFAKHILSRGGDSFFKRIGSDTAANAALLPAVAPVAKQALGMGTVPDAVFSALLGTSAKILKAIAPDAVPKI
mmetsp:Transcript_14614/g.37883  ORF Transcript_14614/g.37883 Transcript_14614/m.37883 type:complete len:187 (-) Transcript_14614:63-623(-)|eukprot:jgi/Tetstr1/427520/TSEL_017646.t1